MKLLHGFEIAKASCGLYCSHSIPLFERRYIDEF